MTELGVTIGGVSAELYAAVPTLCLHLRVTEPTGGRIQAVALRAQVRIEPQQRRYSPEESGRLVELFGHEHQWGESLRPFLWTQVGTVIGAFTGTSEVPLMLPCSYDFEVAAARYLHGLDDGEIPLILLFNGTIFRSAGPRLQVEPLSWETESRYRLPVSVWRQLMDRYFPGGGWLRLNKDTIDALGELKAKHALPSWDEAVMSLLGQPGAAK